MCNNFGTDWLGGTKWYQWYQNSVSLDLMFWSKYLINISMCPNSLLPRISNNLCNHYLLLFAFHYSLLLFTLFSIYQEWAAVLNANSFHLWSFALTKINAKASMMFRSYHLSFLPFAYLRLSLSTQTIRLYAAPKS